MPDELLGLCWSCQRDLVAQNAIWITDSCQIQCCKACWKRIPAAERLKIAIAFHDRSDRGLGVEETLSVIRDLIHSATGQYIERKIRDDIGRDN